MKRNELSLRQKAIKCIQVEIADELTTDNKFRMIIEQILNDYLVGNEDFINENYELYFEEDD